MSTNITAEWTENQSITFDDATPAKTIEGKGSIDLAASGYKKVVVQVEVAFGDSADGDAEIRVRGSSDSGTAKDTVLLIALTVDFTVSTTKRVSISIDEMPWIEIGVYNGNSAVQDISIAAKWAGLKYKST